MAYIDITELYETVPGSRQMFIGITTDMPSGTIFTYQIATDSGFINLVQEYSTTEKYFISAIYPYGQTFYLRVISGSVISDPTSFSFDSDMPIPNFGMKYRMAFKDVLGESFEVRMYFNDWVGSVTDIIGTDNPVTISYSGSDSDVYDPVRDLKGTINVLIPKDAPNFYAEMTNLSDKECWVEIIKLSNNFKYSGWLISDEYAKSFDTFNDSLSLKMVSPLSLMKGVEILDDDGKMLFGNVSISSIIYQCLRLTTPQYTSYEINSDLKESTYTGVADLFFQLSINIEGFNDDNGRPPKAYDLIEKICKSFGFYCIWENDILKFYDIYNDNRTPKEIKIKTPLINTNFLIGNTEHITKQRASKEISTKYEYGRQVGLIPNGRFLELDPASPGYFSKWQYNNLVRSDGYVYKYIDNTNVFRVGNGRKVSPFRARMTGELTTEMLNVNHITQTPFEGLTNFFPVNYKDIINIKVKYRYYDWKAAKGISETVKNKQVPYLYIMIYLIDPKFVYNPTGNNTLANSVFYTDYKDIQGTDWQEDTGIQLSAPYFDFMSVTTPRNIRIAVESTTETQTYEANFRNNYGDGYKCYVVIKGFMWEHGKPATFLENELYIDIESVIATRKTDTEGTNSVGEEIYISQYGDISKIEDTDNAYIGNFGNPYIAGSLLTMSWQESKLLKRGMVSDTLQNWVLRSKMAQRRTPRHKIDCEIKSNDLQMGDTIKFLEGANELLPNKYMIGTYDYNIKQSEVRITAFELNTEDKPYQLAGDDFMEPTPSYDMLENYKIYGS